MNRNNCEINIIVKGRKVTEYQSPMDFQTYVEGRDGSEFEIEFVNNNPFDVEAILSVDGLSVTDGKPAGSDSSGYMVPAGKRLKVPGWTLNKDKVANFFFAGAKGGSYAEQSGQDDRNKGVIGAKVYARKQTYRPYTTPFRGVSKGLQPMGGGYVYGGSAGDMQWSNTADVRCRGMAPMGGGTFSMSTPLGSNVVTSNSVASASVSLDSFTPTSFSADAAEEVALAGAAPVEQTLGTGFGAENTFETTTVEFERGDMHVLMELFYDDAQGLKRRGIDVRRPAARPSAFPADEPKGCVPPQGWTGR